MKNIKSIIWLLIIGVEKDEIIITSTHTDASALVVGSYSGTLSFEDVAYTDVVITFTKIDVDSVQAVTVHIQSTSFNNLDVTGNANVALANDEYLFSSGVSTTQKMCGRLTDNSLVFNVPLSRSGSSLSNASTAKVWAFIGIKN